MLNWLVVGVGDIAVRRVIPAILSEPRSRLYGVVTSDPSKAARYETRAFSSLQEAHTDPRIDAVYLATPVALHHPQALTALAARKHVLCEKPVALDFRQAAEMAEAASQSGTVCGVAYYRRLYPKVMEAKRLMETGAIGKPVLAELNCRHWFNAEDGNRAWLLDKAMAGGGPLLDIGSHRIDLLNYFFGEPVKAMGQRSNAVHLNSVEDNATVLVEYANGVRGVVDIRWHSHAPRDECRITGTDGELVLTPLNGPELKAPGGQRTLPAHENLHYPLIQDFVDAVRDGKPLACPIGEAIRTDWVTSQIR